MRHYNKTIALNKRRELRKNQTYWEKIVWMNLRNRQMLGYKFRRQYSVDHYIIDFYCPELKLAPEIDGVYHDEPDQREYDKKRQKHIEKFGITFLRIKNEEFGTNSNNAFKKIEEKILKLKNEMENN